jgi:hypothetical protein
MRIRLSKVEEFQLLTSVQHGLWGSNSARFKDWRIGDGLVITVDKKLAALAEVSGPPFVSRQEVWDNGLYPHRIPMNFTHFLRPSDRPPILGDIRDVLTRIWGPTYGYGILNQNVIEPADAKPIIRAIQQRENALEDYQNNLAMYLDAARSKRQQVEDHTPRRGRPPKVEKVHPQEAESESPPIPEDESTHTRAQAELIALGKATGCSVWIATNDRSKTYKGKILGNESLQKLPNMGLNEEATKRISLIDIIWINQKAPVCAFEIETSTSIYSGLLRMSDLLAVVPALNIQIFIVAPQDRRDKVMSQLARPTFRKIGLSEYCRFISIEALDGLLGRVSGLDGHIQMSILDKIAEGLEEADEAEDN